MFTHVIFLLLSSALVSAAPHKSKNKKFDGPQTVYDQKQIGDYNIQLHLKDFQIIAMLGDDALGDYDYNYDYADFTIKPSSPTSTSTTSKPTSSSPPPSTTQKEPSSTSQLPLSSSSQPNLAPSDLLITDIENSSISEPSGVMTSNAHPYPIEVKVPQPTKKPDDEGHNVKDSQNISAVDDVNSQELTLETTLNLISSSKPLSTAQTSSSSSSDPSSTSPSLSERLSYSPESPPGKIKVQILEAPSATGLGNPIGIVPGEEGESETNGSVLQSELASYRKCSSGYARDKKGRCRRVRRPGISSQLPFGFSRLASNLATRLRLTPHETPAVTSISTE